MSFETRYPMYKMFEDKIVVINATKIDTALCKILQYSKFRHYSFRILSKLLIKGQICFYFGIEYIQYILGYLGLGYCIKTTELLNSAGT